jgi:hypothetical protein
MARNLRIQNPGAVYPVMNRGDCRVVIIREVPKRGPPTGWILARRRGGCSAGLFSPPVRLASQCCDNPYGR